MLRIAGPFSQRRDAPVVAVASTLVLALSAGPTSAQFVDRTFGAGLAWYQVTWGAALADLDGDGYLDVCAGHHLFEPRLSWSEGDGTFDPNLHPQPWQGPLDRHGLVAVPLGSNARRDVFVTHGGAGGEGSEANELYRNDGGGAFVLQAGAAGMADPDGRSRCASAADYDGDSRVDIWVGKAPDTGSTSSLFRNLGEFGFFDVAATAGLDEPEGTVGGIWGDFDDDRDPDLLVGGEEFPRPTRLWRNDGGVFADVSSLFSPPLPVVSGADWGDLDGDGDLDLAVCDGQIGVFDVYSEGDSVTFFFNTRYSDSGLDGLTIPSPADTARALLRVRAFPDPDLVFLGPEKVNPPPGPVITLTDEYVGEPMFDPGVDRGIFVWRSEPGGDWEMRCSTPDISFDTFDGWFHDGAAIAGVLPVLLEDPGFTSGGPRVWRNDGRAFHEITVGLGLPDAMSNPRDISCIDYDNDGDLDLHVVDMGTTATPNAPDALFRNDGATFADVTAIEGIAGGSTGMGDGGVWGDTDRDGDLDLFLSQGAGPAAYSAFAPALFLENAGARGHSIQVDLIGRGSGAAAMGARVVAVVGATRVVRRVAANSWRGFQDPLRLHLGIGAAEAADSLIVEWPGGRVDKYANVPAGIYRLDEAVSILGAPEAERAGPEWRVEGLRPQPATGVQTLYLSAPGEVDLSVDVYDVAGRLVRTLHRGRVPAGTTPLAWDGLDRFGHRAAPGVYLFRVKEPGGRSISVRSVRLD